MEEKIVNMIITVLLGIVVWGMKGMFARVDKRLDAHDVKHDEHDKRIDRHHVAIDRIITNHNTIKCAEVSPIVPLDD